MYVRFFYILDRKVNFWRMSIASGTCIQILGLCWGDIVDCGIGLSTSYSPASLCCLAGQYDNPMPQSTKSAIQGLRIWLLVVAMNQQTDPMNLQLCTTYLKKVIAKLDLFFHNKTLNEAVTTRTEVCRPIFVNNNTVLYMRSNRTSPALNFISLTVYFTKTKLICKHYFFIFAHKYLRHF
jgi:hypothetical protein